MDGAEWNQLVILFPISFFPKRWGYFAVMLINSNLLYDLRIQLVQPMLNKISEEVGVGEETNE